MPLRLFLGGTFLFAGLDKLLTPSFFVAGAPGSIQTQLATFIRHSPLADLIVLIQPWAIEMGLLIAIAEIAIGLGTLTGFGFRLAASGGAGLAVLFWLTASWATRPYYYGPDLPYAAGWITLALAGHGHVLVAHRPSRLTGDRTKGSATPGRASLVGRRALLEAGVLGIASLVVASLTLPLRAVLGAVGVGAGGDDGAGGPTPAPTPTATPHATVPPGIAVARLADLNRTGSVAFTIPFNAPAPLPAGNPGVIVRLADGSFAAFDATCPHAGCTVEWDELDDLLICPCHGATFDAEHAGRILEGPTDQPLAALPLVLDAATGTFLLRTQ